MDQPRPEKQHVIDELNAVCNSLGKLDENDGTYMKDRDCKACLREIIRHLNNDPYPFVTRIHIGKLNIIKSDLIPLLVQYCDYNDGDPDLFTTVLRLLTNLTSSVLLLFENEEMPTEPEKQQTYDMLLKCLYGYKEAFASGEKIWSVLNVHLRHNLEEEITFERLVILIRNILHIPVDSTSDLGFHSDFDAHDMCLYRMDKGGMLDTIIQTASESEKGTEYCFHITEIIYLMLRDQNPETLATARANNLKRKRDDADPIKKQYLELSARGRMEREMRSKQERVPQIRFRTSLFVAKNIRSLSNEPLIMRHPLNKGADLRESINLGQGKTELRKAKNRKALPSDTSMDISDKNTKSSKVSYSLKNFCRLFVEKIYNNYMQQIKHNLIQKKTQENDESYYLWAIQFFTRFTRLTNMNISNISETLSTSTLHYIQILISSYQDKLKIEKKKFKDVSKRLHLAIRAYREILYLINSIKPDSDFSQTAKKILQFIFNETEYSTLVLTLLQQYEEQKHSLHYLEDLILTNDVFSQLLQEYSESHNFVDMMEENDDEEKDDKEDNIGDEKAEDKDKADGDIAEEKGKEESNEKVTKKKKKKRKSKKIDFKSAHFMSRYCCPDVINAYLKKLKDFKTNDNALNLAILKFLERIVYDCKLDVIFFQASIFKCLIDIMSYHVSMAGHERFVKLGKHLMANFGRMANKRRWMFQELLFWKTNSDCLEIENAIDPPAIHIQKPLDDMESERLFNNDDLQEPQREPGEELPTDTLTQLKAELADSSDEDWDPLPEELELPTQQPKETVEDLLAELGDDPPSDVESTPLPPPETEPIASDSPVPTNSASKSPPIVPAESNSPQPDVDPVYAVSDDDNDDNAKDDKVNDDDDDDELIVVKSKRHQLELDSSESESELPEAGSSLKPPSDTEPESTPSPLPSLPPSPEGCESD